MSECKHETVYRVIGSWAGDGAHHWCCTKCDAPFQLRPPLDETLRKAGERGVFKERIAELEAENLAMRHDIERHQAITSEQADTIMEMEARMNQARHELEKCRMWNGSGYDWHPLHAREAWRVLREVLPTARQRLYVPQEQEK